MYKNIKERTKAGKQRKVSHINEDTTDERRETSLTLFSWRKCAAVSDGKKHEVLGILWDNYSKKTEI